MEKAKRLLRGLSIGAGTYSAAALGVMAWPASGYLALCFGGLYCSRGIKKRLTSMGSAQWAGKKHLKGMLGAKSGLILGRVAGGRELVRLPQAVHTSVFAPTGVGKGVSCILPFLLTCPESCVVVDFKGENAKITAEHRRQRFGHEVVLLDPYNVVNAASDTLNPFDFIDRNSRHAIDDCNDLANALVVRTGEEHERHWNDSAEACIAAAAAMAVTLDDKTMRSLTTVRDILSHPKNLELAVTAMMESPYWDGALKQMGGQLLFFQDREKASVVSTALRHLRFLGTPAVAENVSRSSFDPVKLRKGKLTAYLILPVDRAQAAQSSGLLRMWIGTLLRACVRCGLEAPGLGRAHFIIDEAALVLAGKMESIENALSLGRGFSIRLQTYWQSIGQLQKCFPQGQEQTVLSNTNQIFFGINDNGTADYVSNRLGDQTIIVRDGGTSTTTQYGRSEGGKEASTSFSRSTSSSQNWKQNARRLLQPSELMTLSPREAITFVPGLPPIRTRLLRYYEEKWFTGHRGIRALLDEWARFSRCATLCVLLIWLAAFLTPGAVRALRSLMGR